ncbi:uncharacterized protein LOC114340067 [Diabrotica virgifera virgifera]|uniref:Uncharacterized protein n=1 Tax=Diabrotica virgifera virgifera TaxID=50390 RepID=A0ABM5KSI6_DIAVI|nr:uncharacterized protein LOC114340067 [Diabrotica virgifera virgifera]
MPKVIASLNKGGIQQNSQTHRYKRQVTQLGSNNSSKKKRRVVKKLTRVQLVSNGTLDDSDNQNLEGDVKKINQEATTKRKLRRIKIKKKKLRQNIVVQDDQHLQEATKPRKRIVVTKKRLLTRNKYSDSVSYSETDTPLSSTKTYPYQNINEHTRGNHEYENTSEENEIDDYSDDDDDDSEENEDDEYDDDREEDENHLDYRPKYLDDEDYGDDTTEQNEIVTLKESDFFYTNFEDEPITTADLIPPTEVYTENPTIFTNASTATESVKNELTTEKEVTTEEEKGTTLINSEQDKDVTTERQNLPIEITSETDKGSSVSTTSDVSSTEATSKRNLEDITEEIEDINDTPTFQNIPEYEPYFPELIESLDAPIVLFKTTVLSSIELLTKTVVQSRLRTYTYVITTKAGDEQVVTSTTEVKPHTKTTVTTESITRLKTLTLLDIDPTSTLTSPQQPISSVLDKSQSVQDNQVRNYDEARNLATRIMSNGVEVIVAGDKTIPGDKDYKRLLTSGTYKGVTLKPSTLRENMLMMLPQDSSNIDSLTSSLYPNQFITKTCLTTFTYLTTFLEGSTTTVSSHEQVVSNIATEERNTGKILPTPAVGVTLTQNPNLSVGVFHTTYTYLNTILDGDQPLVVSSKHTVTNTITAPDDYLSLLKVSGTLSPMKDTNTYYSTIGLEKTLYEGNKTSVMSTKEVVTQVVITESVPPRATSVMTSYIALDFKDSPDASFVTTDVVKTYFVTYTYFNTINENNVPTVFTNISVSSDVVTEKLYIIPKTSNKFDFQSKEQRLENNFQIYTTKSYLTTFTYFTTLLQEENQENPTVINSRTSVVENLVSETVDLSLLDKSNLNEIRNAIEQGLKSLVQTITLYNGETFEITAVANDKNKADERINPTKVLPIEKTQMPETFSLIKDDNLQPESSPSIITGSTIVFIDDDPFAQLAPTPVLKKTTEIKTNASPSTIKPSKGLKKSKRSTKSKTKVQTTSISPSKSKKHNTETYKAKPQTEEKNKDKKNTPAKTGKPIQENDLLGLGSINMDSLQAFAPFLNSMAGFISTNLKANRRNDVNVTTTTTKVDTNKITKFKTNQPIKDQETEADTSKEDAQDVQSRSPIYIPVRGLDDEFEIAESQNIASFDWVDPPLTNKKIQEYHAHESALISHGIPISPGDIITTNSDVIVGKPGRVGPRIPSIPVQQVSQENEIPIGMKPPPPGEHWKKNNHEYKRIPVTNNFEKPSEYRHEDYLGPPPPIAPFEYNAQNDKVNEISGNPVYAKNQKNYEPVYPQQHYNDQQYKFKDQQLPAFTHNHPVYAQTFNHEPPTREKPFNPNTKPVYSLQEPVPPKQHSNNRPLYVPADYHDIPINQGEILTGAIPHVQIKQYDPPDHLHVNINNQQHVNIEPHHHEIPIKQYNAQEHMHININNQQHVNIEPHHHEIPIKLQEEILTGGKLNNINVKPSIINNEHFILPEVIERSTGQPLLVNIQPSQVAFVNIPYNRTTALIYGGSTEPHRNGQYFDDPSPYPQPEYSGIEINDPVLPIASIYQPDLPNQKQVKGVIKVENQLIRNEPISSENQKVNVHIQPTKIESFNIIQENQVAKTPPVSYGLVHHGANIDAHVINHNDMFSSVLPSNDQNNNRKPFPPNQNIGNSEIPVDQNVINYRRPTHIHSRPIYNQEGVADPFAHRLPNGPAPQSPNNKHPQLQKYNNNKKNILRPNYISQKQQPEISEFMLPPTTPRLQNKRPYDQKQTSRPISIPVGPEKQQSPKLPPDFKPSYPIFEVHLPPSNVNHQPVQPIQSNHPQKPVQSIQSNYPHEPVKKIQSNYPHEPVQTIQSNYPHEPVQTIQSNYPHEPVQTIQSNYPHEPVQQIQFNHPHKPVQPIQSNYHEINMNQEVGNHKEDDLENEDGEVVQESNSRPLLPGEIPHEIVKMQSSSTERPESRPVFTGHTPLKLQDHASQIPKEKVIYNQTTIGIDLLHSINNAFNEVNNENIDNLNAIPTQDQIIYTISQKPIVFRDEVPIHNFGTTQKPIVFRDEIPMHNFGTTQKPVLIFIDEDEKTKETFFNKENKDRPTVTSLPINTFKETLFSYPINKDRPTVTSLPINRFKDYNRENPKAPLQNISPFKENNYKERPTVTSLPINNFNEYNRERPVTSSQGINLYNDINRERPSIGSQPIHINTTKNTYRERPSVTSLPINNNREKPPYNFNSYKDSNLGRPTSTSQPPHTFKENTYRERPTVTSLPINNFKEYNREKPITSPYNINIYKDYRRPTASPRPVTNYKEFNNRPAVTSLPIDKFQIFNNRERPPITSIASDKDQILRIGTQTEKPFSGVPSKTISFNEIVKKDVLLPKPSKNANTPRTTSTPLSTVDRESQFNTGEIPLNYNNSIKQITDMEIMKPPPPPQDVSKQPPNIYTAVPTDNQQPLYTPNISEEMVPPPPQPPQDTQKVIGMVPPPLTSPKLPPTVTTPKYSMEVDVPSTKPTTSTTTEVNRHRTRRPFTRRPGYRTTTTISSTSSTTTTPRRRPVYPGYTNKPTEETKSTTPKTTISPSPSIKIKPSLEVIIGNPTLESEPTKSSSSTVELSSSEASISTQKVLSEPDLLGMESGIPAESIDSNNVPDVVTPGVHHAGNEIKVILDATTPLPSTIKTVYNETKSKVPIPTRYITHTKTATVTITKTTVIKSLGIPSTLTILVTKTEKMTIVDTVTEVHTLVKPTSIIETITTTVKQASSLYPDDAYGSPYPSIQVKPTLLAPFLNYNDTVYGESSEDNLEDFIIHETDPPIPKQKEPQVHPEDNDSFLVVMTDKNTKSIVKVPASYEPPERDEVITTNKDNNVLLAGILLNHPEEQQEKVLDRCEPECKASRNELCQKLGGHMRCICRPGFARMFPDRPCLPTYTFDLKITLDRIGKDPLHFYEDLRNTNSTEHYKFVQATGEALDRMVMQSDLRDIFHGVKVHTFEPATKGIVSKFHLQLSENIEEHKLEDVLKTYLRNNSFSLGGTDIFASPLMELEAHDFNECAHTNLHDCSENAHCFNLKGTYSCSCKEGFSDMSENMLYPGRVCSAEQVGCEKCNYHGTCYSRGADEVLCECFQWYTGQYCHINLKVLLIALVTLGTVLFGLLLTCIILTCVKGKPRPVGVAGGISILPQGASARRNTLDRRAMIQDTSSEEDNKSETSRYVKKQKPAPQKKASKVSLQVAERGEGGATNHGITFDDQKDRSLTVMIPRAKYHPAPHTSPLSNYTTFDVRKPSVPSIPNEAKLLSFLDAGPCPSKSEPVRKFSNAPSESLIEEKPSSRKTSGALISAGFEVSATVVNNMGTLGTTCGTEADRSENATLIQKISADLLSSTGTRSQFNTLRKSLVDDDLKSEIHMDSESNWLDMLPRVMTVSEARSYDETTIPPPMKCLRTDYDSKPSSQHPNDEANTMAERDLGSTFMLPHTHLYKPDRGSDISGFESL